MKTVYIETSIVSYLASRQTRDLLVTAHQQLTRTWWDSNRNRFQTFVSPVVLSEASRGNPDAAERRLSYIKDISVLEIVPKAIELTSILLREGALPATAQNDAAHIAIAAVHDIDYLLTWNCRHIDNAEMKPIIRSVILKRKYNCPEICTPEELMGGNSHE